MCYKIVMALLSSQMLKTVVAIGYTKKSGEFACNATGFIVGFQANKSEKPDNKKYYLFLVTNRHVFSNKTDICFRFNNNKGANVVIKQPLIASGKRLWLEHPNRNVDMAMLGINPDRLISKNIDYKYIAEDLFFFYKGKATHPVSVGDDIFVLGFPLGIAGVAQNFPYAKHGIVSRMDDEIFREKKAIMVDSSIFPGNSGGPVLLRPQVYTIGEGGAVKSQVLLGVVSSYIPYTDILISRQTGEPVGTNIENSGLSYVVPMNFARQIYNKWIKDKKKLPNPEIKNNS